MASASPSAPQRPTVAPPFPRRFRGYDPEAVDELLDQTSRQAEELLENNRLLRQRADELGEKVAFHEDRGRALQEALVVAQTIRLEARDSAAVEADRIREEARAEADQMLARARDELARVQGKVEEMTRRVSALREEVAGEIEESRRVALEETEAEAARILDDARADAARIASEASAFLERAQEESARARSELARAGAEVEEMERRVSGLREEAEAEIAERLRIARNEAEALASEIGEQARASATRTLEEAIRHVDELSGQVERLEQRRAEFVDFLVRELGQRDAGTAGVSEGDAQPLDLHFQGSAGAN